MSVDLRTRTDGQPQERDPSALLGDVVPAAFAALGTALPDLAARRLRTMVLDVDGAPWTFEQVDGRATVRPGRPADEEDVRAEVRLVPDQLADLCGDLLSPVGLMTAGALDQPRGGIHHLLDWWLVLRAALDVPTWEDAATVRADLPADLQRSFALDDDPAEMREFLERAGYLHVRGVFTADEMAEISAEMDAAAPAYRRGDRRSWWAATVDGDRLVRMEDFDEHSPATAALLADPRLAALEAVPGCGHVLNPTGHNRIEALFKPLGVIEGISDVPWHKDCSLGRHSFDCCRITVGISVTGGGPTSGQLRVIAGSHRVLIWPALLDVATTGLPEVALPTETGDITLHLSCTLHMAQPPTERERRVLYTSFRLPEDEDAQAGHRRLMDVARESAPLTTSQPSTV